MLRLPDFTIDNPDLGIGKPLARWRRLVEGESRSPFTGVYLYYSPSKEVLYVGQAIDVSVRLKHHFNKDQFLTLFPEGDGHRPGTGADARRWTYQNEFPGKGTRLAIWRTGSDGETASRRLEADLIQAHVLAFGHGPRHNRTIPMLLKDRMNRPAEDALRDAEYLVQVLLPGLP